VVSLLALTTAVVQPFAGRAADAGRLTLPAGIRLGIALTATGLAATLLPDWAGMVVTAVVVGAGCGLITPLAFTMLARSTPQERLGQTMGAAEIGRECGDAAGPLLVAGIAAVSTVPFGFLGLAVLVGAAGLVVRRV
jgi:MFS family permease